MKLDFDVDGIVSAVHSIAPELLEHVTKLALSINERKGRAESVANKSFLATLSTYAGPT